MHLHIVQRIIHLPFFDVTPEDDHQQDDVSSDTYRDSGEGDDIGTSVLRTCRHEIPLEHFIEFRSPR